MRVNLLCKLSKIACVCAFFVTLMEVESLWQTKPGFERQLEARKGPTILDEEHNCQVVSSALKYRSSNS